MPAKRALISSPPDRNALVGIRLPDEVIDKIIQFNPESVPVLRVVSRELKRNTEAFLQWNRGEIESWCSHVNSPLSSLLIRNLTRLSHLPGSQPNRINIQFHLTIPRSIRSFCVPQAECPNRILSVHEIDQFSFRIGRIEDDNLQIIWFRLRLYLPVTNYQAADFPKANASAQAIRNWIHTDAHQAELQEITQLFLCELHLTCTPKEIALCTALKTLGLADNQITSLPEGIFQGLTALECLQLNNNLIASLGQEIFQRLPALSRLDLQNNRIATLGQGVFQGLTALQWLNLSNNRITSLEHGVFQGLTALQRLDLDSNQITSLPEGIFQKLTNLQILHLHNNQITFLPERFFQGLTALRDLRLDRPF